MADTEPTPAERADQAFNIIAHAINLAMGGKFPTGMEHLDFHMQVRGAVQYIGALLKQTYPEVEAPEPAKEAEAPAESEVEPVAS